MMLLRIIGELADDSESSPAEPRVPDNPDLAGMSCIMPGCVQSRMMRGTRHSGIMREARIMRG
jgi:hypothetical protein